MNSLRWVIQENLGSSKEIETLFSACNRLGIEALPVKIVPFTNEIPDIPEDKLSIFYGSANFVFNAKLSGKWSPCAFFDDKRFRFSHWVTKYGATVLNGDARICTMKEFSLSEHSEFDEFFIRPDRDLKEFSGQLITFKNYVGWFSKINKPELNMTIGPDTVIIASSPKNLRHEWRLFMIRDKYCSGSHYRSDGNLDVHSDVPNEIIQFAEKQASIWYPDIVYVLDVAEWDNDFYIIEINGFNSTGFYSSDIYKIVYDVSELIISGEQPVSQGFGPKSGPHP